MNTPAARIVKAALCTAIFWISVAAAQNSPPFIPVALTDAASEGNAAFAKKDFETASRAYERVLSLDPQNVMGLVNLGLVEFQLGNTAAAEDALRRAISLRLETSPAWLTLGMIQMDRGDADAAFASLAQAVQHDPLSARARNFLGVVIGRRGWIYGAQQELRRAIELDPTYADAHFNLAAFYMQEDPPAIELARRHYHKALTLGVEKDAAMEKTFSPTPGNP
jgi:Tfp pilus assembly protein PilF